MWTVRALVVACLLVGAACSGAEPYGSLPPAASAPPGASTGAAPTGAASAGPTAADAGRSGTEAGRSGTEAGRSGTEAGRSGTEAGRSGAEVRAAEAEALAQYLRFWTDALPAAAAAPATRRRTLLAPVTAEPQLTHLVRSLAVLDAEGQRSYGRDVPLHQTVRIEGALAFVEGCLDSTGSGVADADGPVTRGVARNPVRANLTRGTDGTWRVSAVTYPRGTTC
ncbi:hypothetical protein [Cryptosporangium aurantiacum]|uniref:Mce-associated membrane protein n=1 Tax=Cryptosporangium aurantiacum TaxID=134849 RepID=A0A1M7MUR1_9ACTN|nr:hypothetical protein [Cryptosporangium aurantiacum]SHM94879.1 hypothetical protein SAMN05443668_102283 [Cryptosporangium aurantiacum]